VKVFPFLLLIMRIAERRSNEYEHKCRLLEALTFAPAFVSSSADWHHFSIATQPAQIVAGPRQDSNHASKILF